MFGTDGVWVPICSLKPPFFREQCPALAVKPKRFFIQACQETSYQVETVINSSVQREVQGEGRYEAGGGTIESILSEADFLVGTATVDDCRSFRHNREGTTQLHTAVYLCADVYFVFLCSENDIQSVLSLVNGEVRKKYLTAANSLSLIPPSENTLNSHSKGTC